MKKSEYAVFKELENLKSNCHFYSGGVPVKISVKHAIFLAKTVTSIISQCCRDKKVPMSLEKSLHVRYS
jgi:hypothetical protein